MLPSTTPGIQQTVWEYDVAAKFLQYPSNILHDLLKIAEGQQKDPSVFWSYRKNISFITIQASKHRAS